MPRLKKLCLNCGEKRAKWLGLYASEDRVFCSQRCAAVHGLRSYRVVHGSVFREWCEGCGWVQSYDAECEYQTFGYHKEGCRVAKKYFMARVKKYGSERRSELAAEMLREDCELTEEEILCRLDVEEEIREGYCSEVQRSAD